MSLRHAAVRALGGVLASWLISGPAAAAGFTVSPTRIDLSARISSALLTIRNDSDQPMRLQVSAFAWSQSPAGEIELTPTTDVIFFPALVTLKAGDERRVRIGTTARPAATEQTYRIFVEQLPPEAAGATPQTGVRVLTRVGIPIFLESLRPVAQPALRDLHLEGSTLLFRLVNDGTVHFVPGELRVRARNGAGATVLERQVTGWYVLAGSHRLFTTPLADPRCGDVRGIAVTAVVNDRTITETIEAPHGICGP